jgi:glycosyltransferase involved in cell wall biosynthesis
MAERTILAYLTGFYARASDTFIRGEVEQLRALGFTIHTFSIRRSEALELTSDDIRREQQNTEYLLERRHRLFFATLQTFLTSPLRFFSALGLAWRTAAPGIRGHLWSIAYLMEACFLAHCLQVRRVCHLHNHGGQNSATVAMLANCLTGIPYSLTIHGPHEFDRPTELALNEKISRAAFVVAICEFGRSQLFRWCGHAHWSKIHVIHCGIDEHFLEWPKSNPPKKPRLVCIGRLAEEKGQLLLIEAVNSLKQQGVSCDLNLIGDGPMREPIEHLIARHGLQDHVHVLGWLNADAVRHEILSSSALVLPSFAEGLPVVIMEALALGRPVITTYIAGIPELIEHGVCGWLVPAGSVTLFADAMKEALSLSPDQLHDMGQQGSHRVRQQHHAPTEAAKLAALLGESAATLTPLKWNQP